MENYEDNDQVEELEQTSVNAWEEIAAARKITFEDIKAHMTGPVLSVCLHIILITLLMVITYLNFMLVLIMLQHFHQNFILIVLVHTI